MNRRHFLRTATAAAAALAGSSALEATQGPKGKSHAVIILSQGSGTTINIQVIPDGIAQFKAGRGKRVRWNIHNLDIQNSSNMTVALENFKRLATGTPKDPLGAGSKTKNVPDLLDAPTGIDLGVKSAQDTIDQYKYDVVVRNSGTEAGRIDPELEIIEP